MSGSGLMYVTWNGDKSLAGLLMSFEPGEGKWVNQSDFLESFMELDQSVSPFFEVGESVGVDGVPGPQGPIGLTGGTGPSGVDGTPKWEGAWLNSTTYHIGDAITDDGTSYVCKVQHSGQQPPNGTYWGVLAAKGTNGTSGTNGAQGPAGPEISPWANAASIVGRYFGPTFSWTLNFQLVIPSGKTLCTGIVVPCDLNVDRMLIQLLSGASGKHIRAGLYTCVNGLPDALVAGSDTGAMDAATSGFKEATISVSLAAGLYFIAVHTDDQTLSVQLNGSNYDTGIPFFGFDNAGVASSIIQVTQAYGAMPATMPSTDRAYLSTVGELCMWLRRAA